MARKSRKKGCTCKMCRRRRAKKSLKPVFRTSILRCENCTNCKECLCQFCQC